MCKNVKNKILEKSLILALRTQNVGFCRINFVSMYNVEICMHFFLQKKCLKNIFREKAQGEPNFKLIKSPPQQV
jgi:hypothetical protein